ncbi:MAG: cupin domain-containing protein [Pseudomonadota bacterium]
MVDITRSSHQPWRTGQARGERYRFIDLGGTRVGARLEELPPGGTSSEHHSHSLEEEHVYLLAGDAVLVLDDEEFLLHAGDHVAFPAGEGDGHHLVNRANTACRYLVYGMRDPNDVVTYPNRRKTVGKDSH